MSIPVRSESAAGPMGMPKSTMRRFDRRAVDPVGHQENRSAHQADQLPGHVKTRPVIDHDGDFLDTAGEGHDRGQGRSDVCFPQMISRSCMRWAGLKKCRPIRRPGSLRTAAISVMGSARGVGREDGLRPADPLRASSICPASPACPRAPPRSPGRPPARSSSAVVVRNRSANMRSRSRSGSSSCS